MSVRLKIWIAMAGLVLWMSGCYLVISHIFTESQFRQFTAEARVQSAEQWTHFIERYYEEHGSFKGIEDAVTESNGQFPFSSGTSLEEIIIRSVSGQELAHITITSVPPDPDDTAGVTVPIVSNGKTVAKAVVYDRVIEGLEVLQETTLRSVATATLVGLLLTAFISLIAGGWLSRLITKPLRSIMDAIRSIGSGNLHTKVNVKSRDEFFRLAGALNDMSKQLNEALQTRQRLVADVAHELRTPVTIIQGQLDLIQDGLQPAEPSSLLPIQDEVIRLRTLIDELHQLALAESHQLTLHQTHFDLVEWLLQLVDKFRPEASAREIGLQFDSPVQSALVYADTHRLTQVFANLLSNALRYTPLGGHISVTVSAEERETGTDAHLEVNRGVNREAKWEVKREAKRDGTEPASLISGFVKVAVTDTGPGIAADKVPHIFDRFYRTEEARSREGGGLGLGLAIAKELAELHGGRIEVQSEPGIGSTFTVILPLYTNAE